MHKIIILVGYATIPGRDFLVIGGKLYGFEDGIAHIEKLLNTTDNLRVNRFIACMQEEVRLWVKEGRSRDLSVEQWLDEAEAEYRKIYLSGV